MLVGKLQSSGDSGKEEANNINIWIEGQCAGVRCAAGFNVILSRRDVSCMYNDGPRNRKTEPPAFSSTEEKL